MMRRILALVAAGTIIAGFVPLAFARIYNPGAGGTVSVASGGTGATSFTTGALVAYNGTSLVSSSTCSIAYGCTGTSTQVTNGVNFFDGTRITSGTALAFDGSKFTVSKNNSGEFIAAKFFNTSTSIGDNVSIEFAPANLSTGRAKIGAVAPGGSDAELALYTSNSNASPTEKVRITDIGNFGIGSSTPVANFQATTASANATSTVELGKSGQTLNGTCIKLYRTDGTTIYAYVLAGATAFTLSTTACASVTGF